MMHLANTSMDCNHKRTEMQGNSETKIMVTELISKTNFKYTI